MSAERRRGNPQQILITRSGGGRIGYLIRRVVCRRVTTPASSPDLVGNFFVRLDADAGQVLAGTGRGQPQQVGQRQAEFGDGAAPRLTVPSPRSGDRRIRWK